MNYSPVLFFVTVLVASCGGEGTPPTENPDLPNQDTLAQDVSGTEVRARAVSPVDMDYTGPIRLMWAEDGVAPERMDLKLSTTPDDKTMTAAFSYQITGFDLKAQTPDAAERNCANSADGQHIHFILNNKPYLAKYEPSFTEAVDPGNNVLLSFLSRSYHESVKQGGAFTISQFAMPGGNGIPEIVTKDPTLFYSRPKGAYKKSEGDRILLDLYLINATLSEGGFNVRATVDGVAFLLDRWAPYFIMGLELGPHTVRLELLDKDGNLVPGAFNDSGIRSFDLLEG